MQNTKTDGTRPIVLHKESEYPLSRLSAKFDVIDQAEVLKKASFLLGTVANAKLELLVSQIKFFQEQAKEVIKSAEKSYLLHSVDCKFVKRPGQTYHLYSKGDLQEDLYFSMLSPEEWGSPPHRFVGSFTLNENMSWDSSTE